MANKKNGRRLIARSMDTLLNQHMRRDRAMIVMLPREVRVAGDETETTDTMRDRITTTTNGRNIQGRKVRYTRSDRHTQGTQVQYLMTDLHTQEEQAQSTMTDRRIRGEKAQDTKHGGML